MVTCSTAFLAIQLGIIFHTCFAEVVITADNGVNWNMKIDEELIDTLDWRDHPCRRACKDNAPPMDCYYLFRVEHYETMSKACYDCPYNQTDCFRPHCISSDGVKRSLILVNRQMPGPSIEVCQGDRIVVDVINSLTSESTSMHWHGQHHRATPYMDGVPYVTQCPILPGATFRYNFIAATAGTHFWHSHSGLQRGDGMFGPLIIRVPPSKDHHKDLYDFDEHNMLIQDWGHLSSTEKFLAHHHSNGDNKSPNLLVNGLGRYLQLQDANGTVIDMPAATFLVKQNFRYRFRLVNTGFLNCPIEVSVDNHTMYIVSTDGNDIDPIEAESLVSYAGERFDFIIEMDQDIDNYWIRFRGLMDCDERFLSAHQVAVLRYAGAPDMNPIAEVSYDRIPMNTTALQVNALNQGTETNTSVSMPLLAAMDPNDESNTREPDQQFYISYDFYNKDNPHFHRKNLYGFHQVHDNQQRLFTPQLNHITMKLPPFPLLSQRDSIGAEQFCNESTVQDCDKDFCVCTHVLQVKLGNVVELVLVDKGFTYDANHPFHLHGHRFRVVAMEKVGKNVTVEEVKELDRKGLIRRKLDRAPFKDTVTVPDGGYTIVRFHADNPGYWIFHCHIDFHMELGMSLIFKAGEHEDFLPVPENFPQCDSWMPSDPPEIRKKVIPETTTSTGTPVTVNNGRENEIDDAIRKEEESIIKWLPLILRELGVASSASLPIINSATITICIVVASIRTVL
ncbi:L-ascorbate oxidase isoform X2 [Cephus cinctus]|nr:L-ascorbate oxidase isoform X2 [Cephus cinctus]XP_015589580.1 L-ascorbate oxidase isoform X2 [Cephus cinctus]XP_024938204.1 L-ascorbate oxidase isoform X2 [Cephus cinctus]